MQKGLRFTDANFKHEVLESDIPVLVDFWASWCPPCKMMEPLIDELALEFEGRVKIGKLNVDQNPKTPEKFTIAGVPTFMLFENGKASKREVGARSKQQLRYIIQEIL